MGKLIDIIFKGKKTKVDLSFIEKIIKDSFEIRFNSPEIYNVEKYSEIISIFNSNNYIDLNFNNPTLNIDDFSINNVFIDITIEENNIELLLFFDLCEIGFVNNKINIDFVKNWCSSFIKKYLFELVLCQMDNGDEKEYYFINDEYGPLYYNLEER